MKIGDIIKFGKYNWHVLDVQDDKALIISEDIIDNKAYHTIYSNITWQHSHMHEYLNDDFCNTFTPEEQELIVKTSVINDDNPKYGTPGGSDTIDKIFLLSIDEYKKYRNAISNISGWWWLRSPGDNSYRAAYVDHDGYINDGFSDYYGGNVIVDYGVRPALWIKL